MGYHDKREPWPEDRYDLPILNDKLLRNITQGTTGDNYSQYPIGEIHYQAAGAVEVVPYKVIILGYYPGKCADDDLEQERFVWQEKSAAEEECAQTPCCG